MMSIPFLRTHPQPTFDHSCDRFVFGFDSEAATAVGIKRILTSKSSAALTPHSLFKKHTTTRLALHRCCTSSVGLHKGMS